MLSAVDSDDPLSWKERIMVPNYRILSLIIPENVLGTVLGSAVHVSISIGYDNTIGSTVSFWPLCLHIAGATEHIPGIAGHNLIPYLLPE